MTECQSVGRSALLMPQSLSRNLRVPTSCAIIAPVERFLLRKVGKPHFSCYQGWCNSGERIATVCAVVKSELGWKMERKKGNTNPVSRGKSAVQVVWAIAMPGTEDEAVEK
jgi:hypothetical protein